jgi:hypothetical protein
MCSIKEETSFEVLWTIKRENIPVHVNPNFSIATVMFNSRQYHVYLEAPHTIHIMTYNAKKNVPIDTTVATISTFSSLFQFTFI